MNDTELLRQIGADLQRAPAQKVVYLEGTTDLPVFFALLGVPTPRDGLHDGVLVRGLDQKSGNKAVIARVAVALSTGYDGIFGITDGDGESCAALEPSFAAPFAGPAFRWPSYSIENLLVKTGWPWGSPPDWTAILLQHVPYVVLNVLHRELRESLQTLRLQRFQRPTLEDPLETTQSVVALLARDKHLLMSYDVEARFNQEANAAEAAIRSSLDEGHALVDGKWLVDVFAPRTLGTATTPPRCRSDWIAHAVSVGGLPEVRDLWQRITGRPP